jgi:hypothetical protein
LTRPEHLRLDAARTLEALCLTALACLDRLAAEGVVTTPDARAYVVALAAWCRGDVPVRKAPRFPQTRFDATVHTMLYNLWDGRTNVAAHPTHLHDVTTGTLAACARVLVSLGGEVHAENVGVRARYSAHLREIRQADAPTSSAPGGWIRQRSTRWSAPPSPRVRCPVAEHRPDECPTCELSPSQITERAQGVCVQYLRDLAAQALEQHAHDKPRARARVELHIKVIELAANALEAQEIDVWPEGLTATVRWPEGWDADGRTP